MEKGILGLEGCLSCYFISVSNLEMSTISTKILTCYSCEIFQGYYQNMNLFYWKDLGLEECKI